MSTNLIASEIRRVAKLLDDAVEDQEIEKILSCFAVNGEIEVFGLIFKGIENIRKAVEWMNQRFGKIKFQPLLIMVDENNFFEEFVLSATLDGKRIEIKAAEILVYENYKIISLRLYLDRLEIARAISKGFIERQFTNWIHKETLKGLQ